MEGGPGKKLAGREIGGLSSKRGGQVGTVCGHFLTPDVREVRYVGRCSLIPPHIDGVAIR